MISLIEKIHWSKASERLPDSDETVLIVAPEYDEPVSTGYHDGEVWRTVDGFPFKDGEVQFWAPKPRGPQ